MSNIVDFDVSMLLDIDVDAVYPAGYPKFGGTTLKLSDLDNIDWDLVASSVLGVLDPVGQLRDWLAGVLSGFFDSLKKFFEGLISPIRDAIASLLDTVKRVVVDPILSALKWISDNFFKLAGAVSDLISKVVDTITKLPDYVRGFIDTVSRVFGDLVDRVKSGFSWFIDQVAKIPDFLRGLVENISRVLGDLAERVRAGFSWFIEQVAKLPDTIRDLLGKVAGVIGDLLDRIRAGFGWLIEQVGKIPDLVRGVAEKVTGALVDLAEKAGRGLATLLDLISKAPALIRDTLTTILGDVAKGIGGVVEWVRRGFEGVAGTLSSWFEGARGWFEAATGALRQLGSVFMGFVNAIMQLPERLRAMFEGVVKFFEGLWAGLQEFIKDPAKWLSEHIVTPLWSGLQWLGGKLWEGLQWLWSILVKGAEWLWGTLKTAGEWLLKALSGVYEALHTLFVGAVEAVGKVAEALYGFFINSVMRLKENVKSAVESTVKPVISEFMKAVGWATPPGLTLENFAGAWATSFACSIPL